MLFHALLAAWHDKPQCTVLIQPGAEDWSFAQLNNVVAHYAACLSAYRVRSGDRVLVHVEKSPYAIALYLACLRQGVVFVPLNTACTASELNYFITDADPALVIQDALFANPHSSAQTSSDENADNVTRVTLDARGSGSFVVEDAQPVAPYQALADTPAAMVYTSGTTGRAKGALLTHLNLLSNARALVEVWEFSEHDVLLHALPVFHVHGLFIALHTALLSGAAIIVLPRFAVEQVVEYLPKASVMMGVPTYYTRLLSCSLFTRAVAEPVRLFISGSAPLLPQTFVEFEQRTGQRIVERYGMSETNILCSNPLHGERMPGTVGFALPGVTLRIADDNDQALPAGEPGAIQVRGDNVLHAYWRREDLQHKEFTADGYFKTGDVGFCSQDGRLTLSGRDKDLIISGGLNVYPAEIERALDAQNGVLESAVVGIAHPDYGEQVIAYVVPEARETLTSEDAAAALIGQLRTAARTLLVNYKCPKQFHLIDALPRNTMGKVQKYRLREHAERALELD